MKYLWQALLILTLTNCAPGPSKTQDTWQAGEEWELKMDKFPRRRYHGLLVPKKPRAQFVSEHDILSVQEFLSLVDDPYATMLHNSLNAGGWVDSLHFHLNFEDFPD